MSHISTVKTKIKFTDAKALIEALGQFGKVIGANSSMGSVSVVLKTPTQDAAGRQITSLSFMQQGNEMVARANQWGNETQYKTLVDSIAQQYSKVLTQNFIKERRLSLVSAGTDTQNNIRLKVRSY